MKIVATLLLVLGTLIATRPAAATTIAVPSPVASLEGGGNFVFSNLGGITYQQLMASSVLGIPTGAHITGIAFRANGNETTTTALSLANLEIHLGTSPFAVGSLGTSVAGNEGADTALVRSGSITFPANSFPVGSSPNAFGPLISFATPYVYEGGALLLTISASASNRAFKLDAGNSSQLSSTTVQSRERSGYGSTTVTTNDGAFGLAAQFTYTVPEPSSVAMAGVGFAALFVLQAGTKARQLRKA